MTARAEEALEDCSLATKHVASIDEPMIGLRLDVFSVRCLQGVPQVSFSDRCWLVTKLLRYGPSVIILQRYQLLGTEVTDTHVDRTELGF